MRLKAKDVIATILAAAIAVPYSWPGGGRVRSGRTWSLSGWGLSTVVFRLDCPLTYTEDRARRRAGQPGLGTGFIDHYLTWVAYPQRCAGLVQPMAAATVTGSWIGALILWRRQVDLRHAGLTVRPRVDPSVDPGWTQSEKERSRGAIPTDPRLDRRSLCSPNRGNVHYNLTHPLTAANPCDSAGNRCCRWGLTTLARCGIARDRRRRPCPRRLDRARRMA
jgi:hypothetical protein